jgi:hypothetical protein
MWVWCLATGRRGACARRDARNGDGHERRAEQAHGLPPWHRLYERTGEIVEELLAH